MDFVAVFVLDRSVDFGNDDLEDSKGSGWAAQGVFAGDAEEFLVLDVWVKRQLVSRDGAVLSRHKEAVTHSDWRRRANGYCREGYGGCHRGGKLPCKEACTRDIRNPIEIQRHDFPF